MASITCLFVLPSGDIRVFGKGPHDYGILSQDWPSHPKLGPLILKVQIVPEEKTVDQSVLILGLHVSITDQEIT
jgi:hypothetical protein